MSSDDNGQEMWSQTAIGRAPFVAFTDEALAQEHVQWIYDQTIPQLDALRDAWFDAALFTRMLQESLQDADAHDMSGRPQHGDKVRFSRSELAIAFRHGQRDASEMAQYLKYRFEFAVYPARKLLKSFPIVLAVEPTSVCNLRCPMCFIVDPRLSRNRSINGMMRFTLFTRILDEAREHGLRGLVMASRGEPTLNPEFPAMLEYARRCDILDIKINTNATYLTPALSRRILAAEPDLVVFSVDTAEPEVYGQIRVGADFEQVLDNIKTFAAIREREFPQSRTRTRATMVMVRPDQAIERSRDFWLQHADEVGVNPVFERLNIYDLSENPVTTPCSLLWERLYVWWDGTVNPCDADYLSHLSVGRLQEGVTISSLWTGQAMQALRERHRTGFKRACEPCRRCPGY